jgi:ketosteroid isomerase-like protein
MPRCVWKEDFSTRASKERNMINRLHAARALWLLGAMMVVDIQAGTDQDSRVVAELDTHYQAAVERGDWQAMDRILHPDFVLVLGDGTVYTRKQLIDSARGGNVRFDEQVEVPGTQVVRMFGNDTATVTALLIVKGTRPSNRTTFDYKLWFTDTYVRTPQGWRYAFGQASTPLPR